MGQREAWTGSWPVLWELPAIKHNGMNVEQSTQVLTKILIIYHMNPHQLSNERPGTGSATGATQVEWNVMIEKLGSRTAIFTSPNRFVQWSRNKSVTSWTFVFHSNEKFGSNSHFNSFALRIETTSFHCVFCQSWNFCLQGLEIDFFQSCSG